MYKKIKNHPTTLKIYGNRLAIEGLTNQSMIEKQKNEYKIFLDKESKSSKTYKSELKWFEDTWSRFKPGLVQG